MKKDGLTLLEIIIVIIIVGVLSALALPRLFKSIEVARVTEAYNSMMAIRSQIEKCALGKGGHFSNCNIDMDPNFSDLTMENPGNAPGAHFSYYSISIDTAYAVIAERTAFDNGGNYAGDSINIVVNYVTGEMYSCASGVYVSKRWPNCPAPIASLL